MLEKTQPKLTPSTSLLLSLIFKVPTGCQLPRYKIQETCTDLFLQLTQRNYLNFNYLSTYHRKPSAVCQNSDKSQMGHAAEPTNRKKKFADICMP